MKSQKSKSIPSKTDASNKATNSLKEALKQIRKELPSAQDELNQKEVKK